MRKFTLSQFFCLCLLCICPLALADQYAFLVGVRDYSLQGELTSLKFTEGDVHTLASTLFKAGVPQENIVLLSQRMAARQARLMPTAAQIRREFDLVLSELGPGDSIIVGFSGHGLQFKNDPVNYFCPVDAKPDDKSTLISLAKIYEDLESCKAQTKLLLVDACRDDPLTGLSKAAKRIEIEPINDRAPPVLAGGTVAIFSCSASQQSFEAPDLNAGVFFHYVNRALAGEADEDGDEAVDLIELEFFTIKNVQKWARVNLGRKQIPERRGTARGAMELVNFDRVKPTENMPNPPNAPRSDASPKSITNSLGMKLVLIPAGDFRMGSRESQQQVAIEFNEDPDTFADEHPLRKVTIARDFYMGATEVTHDQVRRFIEDSGYKTQAESGTLGEAATSVGIDRNSNWRSPDGSTPDPRHPVVMVTCNDAVAFCNWLSKKESLVYRLPTDEEWEYAARAGSETRFWNGNDPRKLTDIANVPDRTLSLANQEDTYPTAEIGKTWVDTSDGFAGLAPVGSFPANPWGLHDVHGNVWEWCSVANPATLKITDMMNIAVIRGGCLF